MNFSAMLYEGTIQVQFITISTTFRFVSLSDVPLPYLHVQHQHAEPTCGKSKKISPSLWDITCFKKLLYKKIQLYKLLEFPEAVLSLLIMH